MASGSSTSIPRYISPQPIGAIESKGSLSAPVQIEAFLDYRCPFSCRMFQILKQLAAMIDDSKLDGEKYCIKLIQVPQPWHPQSGLLHLAARAAILQAPEKFWEIADAMFSTIDTTTDEMVWQKTPEQIQTALAEAIGEKTGIDAAKIIESLNPENVGNVVKHLKFHVRYHRVRGVHVTPTVFINGIEEPKISSGWSLEQWQEYLNQY